MRSEPVSKYKEVLEFCGKLVANIFSRKRKVATPKVNVRRMNAIRELNDHLKVFLDDREAWLDLSHLYLRERDYPNAADCIEKLIVIDPLNSLYLRRLADIRYSEGGVENVEQALSYFDQASKLNTTCVLSLIGIVKSCKDLLFHATENRRKELILSAKQAICQLEDIFDASDCPSDSLIRGVVEELSYTIQQFSRL
uniref:ER membrane protein complex subunit 2 n=1 Tax=Steinernema glaseri TaxID=37863 RepID=A0A1I7ZJT1_9BILA